MNLLEKAQLLAKYLGDSKDADTFRELNQMYKQAKNLTLLESLTKNDGIIFIVDYFSKELRDINTILLSAGSEELNDRQRDRLIDKKSLYTQFISMFTDNDKHIQGLEQKLDYQLEQFNN